MNTRTFGRRLLLSAALFTLTPSSSLANEPREITFRDQGLERTVVIHVPSSYSSDIAVPLVLSLANSSTAAALEMGARISLHASTDIQAFFDSIREQWDAKSEAEGFLLVGVAGAGGMWNEGSGRGSSAEQGIDDVAFVLKVLERVRSEYSIDAAKIYAAGMSMSGGMVFRLGMEAGEHFTALASHSSAYWLGIKPIESPPHMLYIIGDSDLNNPLEGGGINTPKRPVQETVDSWAASIGAPPSPTSVSVESTITVAKYGPGRGGAEFEYWLVPGLGHTWLGSDRLPESQGTSGLKSTDIMWKFFSTHSRTK